jgi:hypothetical protein
LDIPLFSLIPSQKIICNKNWKLKSDSAAYIGSYGMYIKHRIFSNLIRTLFTFSEG